VKADALSDVDVLYLSFARALLRIAEAQWQDKDLPQKPYLYTKFKEGRVVHAVRSTVELRDIVPDRSDRRFPTEQAHAWVRKALADNAVAVPALSDGAGAKITSPSFEQIAPHLVADLLYPFRDAVSESNSVRIPDDVLLKHYRNHSGEWAKRTSRREVIVPIVGLKLTAPTIRIGKHLQLRKLSGAEKDQIWNTHQILIDWISLRRFADTEVFLVGEYDHPDAVANPHPEILRDVESAITALRLFKSGAIGTPGICVIPKYPRMTRSGIHPRDQLRVSSLWSFPAGREYEIPAEDAEQYVQRFEGLSRASKAVGDQLGLSVGRFNLSYVRENDVDRLIDLVIALESCLVKGNKSEISYRLAMNAAALISDIADPTSTFKIIKTAYDLRSATVHQGRLHFVADDVKAMKKAGFDLSGFVDAVEGATRHIIWRLVERLSSGESIQPIVEGLRDQILAGMKKGD
jgi:hypothetical protein